MEIITKNNIKLDLPEYITYLNDLITDNSVLAPEFQGFTFSIALSEVNFHFNIMSESIETELDNVVNTFLTNFDSYTLDATKVEQCKEIDLRTDELLMTGFTYGADNYIFDMLNSSQINYLGLNLAALNQLVTGTTMLTFGEENNGIHAHCKTSNGDAAYYYFVDCGDIINFFMSGMGFVNATLQSGWDLKDQINNSSTIEEINAIEDLR